VLKVGGYALQRTAQFEVEFARLVDRLAADDTSHAGVADGADGGAAPDRSPLDGARSTEGRGGVTGDGERSHKVGSR